MILWFFNVFAYKRPLYRSEENAPTPPESHHKVSPDLPLTPPGPPTTRKQFLKISKHFGDGHTDRPTYTSCLVAAKKLNTKRMLHDFVKGGLDQEVAIKYGRKRTGDIWPEPTIGREVGDRHSCDTVLIWHDFTEQLLRLLWKIFIKILYQWFERHSLFIYY